MTGPLDTPVLFAAPDVSDDDVEAVVAVLRSGWWTTGEQAFTLERELAAALDMPHVVTVSSCTAALEIAYAALDLPRGATIGVPAWTFASSALAPARRGAVPVLIDVGTDDLNMDPVSLAAALEVGLDAVLPVHFGGVPVDRTVHELCADAGVPVIEDAAHALGASDVRGPIGGRGSVAAAFSFYATKNLSCGEGGALATDREDVARFARSYRQHGLSADAWSRYQPGGRSTYDIAVPGMKANLPDILAALARSQLARFDDLQAARRSIVERYRCQLAGVSGLRFVPELLHEQGADHLLVVALPEGADRSAVVTGLETVGVSTSVHFRPLSQFTWFRTHARIGPTGLSGADRMADRALSLPLHPGLLPSDVDRVCQALASVLSR